MVKLTEDEFNRINEYWQAVKNCNNRYAILGYVGYFESEIETIAEERNLSFKDIRSAFHKMEKEK